MPAGKRNEWLQTLVDTWTEEAAKDSDRDGVSDLLDEAPFDPHCTEKLCVDSDGDGVREKDDVELRVLFQTSIEPLRQVSQEQVKRDLEAIGIRIRSLL